MSEAQVEAIGKALPDYTVERELGRGAMGIVYGGRHKKLGRMVAIKELPASFADDADVRSRFVDEAKTLASLSHPHVVPIFDYVEREGQCLLVMEALPGGTVWERFVADGMTMTEACATVMAACSGLEHAHEKGVLHRDMKPENLMFSVDNDIKVTDFGIAKVVNGAAQMATSDGSVLGTPAYMAPEQGEGLAVDARADIYATGTMLYELLSGRLPFEGGDTPLALLAQRTSNDPRPLKSVAPQVPDELASVTMKAIARDRKDRYTTAEDFGCAIGEAAAKIWGPDWLDTAGVRVKGSDKMAVAARTTLGGTAPAPTTGRTTTDRAGSNETIAPGAKSRPGAAKETMAPGEITEKMLDDAVAEAEIAGEHAPSAPVENVSMRPDVDEHQAGVDLADVDVSRLVNVGEVVRPPSVPGWLLGVAAASLALGVLIALVGFGTPNTVADPAAVGVSVNAVAVTAEDIEIDLADTVVVTGLPDGTEVEISFAALGVPLGATKREIVSNSRAELDPGLARWTAGGAVTATLSTFDPTGAAIVEHEFLAVTTQPWYLTATGIAGILVVLFALATIESNLRPLRKGRRRTSSIVGAVVAGIFLGLGLCIVGSAARGVQLTMPMVALSAALAAGGCLALALFHAARGRKRRMVRAAKARGIAVVK